MKKRNLLLVAALMLGAMLLGVLLLVGCEVSSADEAEVAVSPQYAELSQNQSVTLTASGWDSYEWSLSNPSIGYLSSTRGPAVVYTVLSPAPTTTTGTGTNAVTTRTDLRQTVTVRAAISRTTNNTDIASGQAIIRHL